MATIQPTIPHLPAQAQLFGEPRSVLEARKRVLSALRSSIRTINAEIIRLEATGDLVDADIEKAYAAFAWAVDAFREEQKLAQMAADFDRQDLQEAKRGSGRFHGGLGSAKGVPCSWQ